MNRLPLDVRPDDRDGEIAGLISLGATGAAPSRWGSGAGQSVMRAGDMPPPSTLNRTLRRAERSGFSVSERPS
jgi:hypothetical protein